jgi:hypothetical protein
MNEGAEAVTAGVAHHFEAVVTAKAVRSAAEAAANVHFLVPCRVAPSARSAEDRAAASLSVLLTEAPRQLSHFAAAGRCETVSARLAVMQLKPDDQ